MVSLSQCTCSAVRLHIMTTVAMTAMQNAKRRDLS